MNDISERLKKIRGGLSKVEFCKLIGVPVSTYSNYENGARTPESDFINKVCSGLGLSFLWLTKGVGNIFGSNTTLHVKFLLFLARDAAQFIEVRGSDRSRQQAVNHVVIRGDGQIGYYAGMLNCDRPPRSKEVTEIRNAFLSVCPCNSIDGSQKYLSHGKEVDLLEGLSLSIQEGEDLLFEIQKYSDSTGITQHSLSCCSSEDDLSQQAIEIEMGGQMNMRPHTKNDIYLPETRALADAIDRLLRDQNQFRRSELTLLVLNFLKEHGLDAEHLPCSNP